MLQFQFQTVVRATPEAVFRFHERPDAIMLLTPRWQPVRMLLRKGGLEAGSEVRFRVWMGPLPVTWVARHVPFDGSCGFADEQVQGPFQFWRHEHRFETHTDGTLLVDAISCALPLAPLSHWLGGWLLRVQLKAMFRYRHAVTRKHCETHSVAVS